jgi:hypothetical protein
MTWTKVTISVLREDLGDELDQVVTRHIGVKGEAHAIGDNEKVGEVKL